VRGEILHVESMEPPVHCAPGSGRRRYQAIVEVVALSL